MLYCNSKMKFPASMVLTLAHSRVLKHEVLVGCSTLSRSERCVSDESVCLQQGMPYVSQMSAIECQLFLSPRCTRCTHYLTARNTTWGSYTFTHTHEYCTVLALSISTVDASFFTFRHLVIFSPSPPSSSGPGACSPSQIQCIYLCVWACMHNVPCCVNTSQV